MSKAVRAKQPRNKKRERTQMEDEADDGKGKDEQSDERERKREREDSASEATDLNAQPPAPPSLSQDEVLAQADLAMVNMNIPMGMENVAPANVSMDNGMGIHPDDLVLPFPPTLDDLQDPFTSLETEFNSWWENEGI